MCNFFFGEFDKGLGHDVDRTEVVGGVFIVNGEKRADFEEGRRRRGQDGGFGR